jgi:hypothetical protein
VETTRTLLGDQAFSARHRASPQAFTRVRALPCGLVVALILRKGVKSLQNWVNEAVGQLGTTPVSASAFSKARYRLRHIAFMVGDEDAETIRKRLTALFLTNPTKCREGRNPPRRNTSDRGLLDYHRRRRKHCY